MTKDDNSAATNTPIWQWPELCEALDLASVDGPDITGIAIDSRRLQPGDLFVALPGDPGRRFTATTRSNRDGHDFLDQAFAAGAAGALVSEQRLPGGVAGGRSLLVVADTLDALWQLGAARRRQLDGPVVAVTGSSGKTTAKAYLAAALTAAATPGSLNNHIGVPLSIALTPRSAGPVVLELGMNHPGEIAPLARLARPDVAVVVNVGTAHIENFDDPDGIRREKLSIAEGLSATGILVVHDEISLADIPSLPDRVVRFGQQEGSDVQLLDIDGLQANYQIDGTEQKASVPGGGIHRAQTLGAVLAVLRSLGMDLTAALKLPQNLVPAGRGAIEQVGGITLIDDSYNANPASMAASIKQLRDHPPAAGARYALLGEMKELGDYAEDAHRQVCELAADLDGYWLVGESWPDDAPGNVLGRSPRVDQEPFRSELIDHIFSLDKGHNLLIKGSNSIFWQSGFSQALVDAVIKAQGAG